MSADQNQLRPPYVPPEFFISFNNFQKFLDAKGLEKACYDCGTEHWDVPVASRDPKEMDAPVYVCTMPDPKLNSYAAFYHIICQNCGYTKLINAKTVQDWMKSNG